MKKKNQLYISGPITIDRENYIKHFAEAEEFCKNQWPDLKIINPGIEDFKFDDPVWDDFDRWKAYIKEDIDTVSESKAIYLLRGWQNSPGANIEYWTAIKFGLDIYYEDKLNKDSTLMNP